MEKNNTYQFESEETSNKMIDMWSQLRLIYQQILTLSSIQKWLKYVNFKVNINYKAAHSKVVVIFI